MAAIGFWTDDRIDMLRRLYAAGMTGKMLAVELNSTRSAVLGKIWRLGLESPLGKKCDSSRGCQPVSRMPRAPKAPRPPGIKFVTTAHSHIMSKLRRTNAHDHAARIMNTIEGSYTLRCVEIEPLHKTLMDLGKDDCRYPYSDGPFTFCGHPKKENSSYCVPHHHLVWVKPLPVSRVREAA